MARARNIAGGAFAAPLFFHKKLCRASNFPRVLRRIALKKRLRKMSGVIIDD